MKRIGLSVLALTLWTSSALAQTPAPAPAAPSTEIGGLVDVYYDFYSNKSDGQYRNFDTKHNQFAMSMAQVWLAKAPTESSRVGFKFKLNFGPASSNFIHALEPGGTPYNNIQEAYVSYLAPVGKGLQLDAGVFVTPAGAEVIEAKDNANYSRGLLFALAIPYYHSGVRLSYAATDKVTVMGGLVNGWNNIVDNNTGKTFMGAVTVKPSSTVSVIGQYIAGPEKTGTNDDWRHLFDAIISAGINDKLTFTANYDYGREKFGSSSAKWQGLAAYLKMQATPTVAFTPRFEIFNDSDGFATGQSQKLKEITGTLELKAADNLQWRLELRRDMSDKEVFVNDKGALKKSQTSIGFGLLYSFAGKIQ
jgi:hypothetical protein